MIILLFFVFGTIVTIFRFIFNDINYIQTLALFVLFIFIIFNYKNYFYRGTFNRQFRKAIKLHHKDKEDEALKIYNRLSKEGKKYPILYYNSSIILFRKGKYEKALNQVNIAIKLKPKYKKAKLFKGEILNYINRYDESLKCYDEILKEDKVNKEALEGKIESLINLDQEHEALNLINNSLESNENDEKILELKVNAFFNLQEYEKSLEYANEILLKHKKNKGALFTKIVILTNLEKDKEVLKFLNEYKSLIVDDIEKSIYYYLKGFLCKNIDKEESLNAFNKSLVLNPNKIFILRRKIAILDELNKKDELIKCVKKNLELINEKLKLNPHDTNALLYKVMMYIYLEEFDKANSLLNSIKVDSTNKYSLNYKGYLLRKLGRFDEAIESIDQALEILPNSVDYLWSKAYVLDKMDKFNEALNFYDKALELSPNNKELEEDKEKLLKRINK